MPKISRPGPFFALILFLFAMGLIGFFTIWADYYSYTLETIEKAASAGPLAKESLQMSRPFIPYDTEIKYRKFYITAPNAQKVELAADFNQWGKFPLELKAYRKGYFETSVALASGEYKYVFVVDGKEVLDTMNNDRQWMDGRQVCIKTVK